MAAEAPLELIAWDWHMLREYPGDGPTNVTTALYDEYKTYVGQNVSLE